MTREYQHRTDPTYRVTVDSMTDTDVVFSRQGGGFRLSALRSKFDADFEPVTAPPAWRQGYVSAEWLTDADGNYVYLPCWTNGDLWNGWSMPHFQIGAVRALRTALKVCGGTPLEWAFNEKYVLAEQQDDEVEVYARVMINGIETWPVGAGSWCWDSIVFVPTVEESIARIKREILDLVKSGQITVEQTFCDFGDLPLDANCLGGFADDSLFDAMIVHYGGRDEHEGMPQGILDHINAAQEAVHQWLARREHLKELS